MPVLAPTSASLPTTTLHSLPCSITMDESLPPRAAVDMYFKPVPIPNDADEGNRVAAQFRGRGLIGRQTALPKTTIGVTLAPATALPHHLQASHDSESTHIPIESTFATVTVWGHDFAPTKDGNVVRIAEEWIELSKAIHGEPE